MAGAGAALSAVLIGGYEIHAGQTAPHPAMVAKGDAARSSASRGRTAAATCWVYLHGLFEDAAVLQALFSAGAPSLDAVFDQLAANVERAFSRVAAKDLRRATAKARV